MLSKIKKIIEHIDLHAHFYLWSFFLLHLCLFLFLAKSFLTDEIHFKYYFGYMQNDFGWISSAYILGYENDLIRSLGDAYRLPSYVIYQSLFVMLFERPIIAIKIDKIQIKR